MFMIPFSRRSDLSRSFERLFDESFERMLAPLGGTAEDGSRSPALDVSESDSAYTVKLDLPGVAKEDVKVAVDGRRVTVEAQTKREDEKKEGDRVVYRERAVSSYARSFTLPSDVSQSDASAKLDNGVLTLTLPKRQAVLAKRITVN
jgi:HSP20 family protein